MTEKELPREQRIAYDVQSLTERSTRMRAVYSTAKASNSALFLTVDSFNAGEPGSAVNKAFQEAREALDKLERCAFDESLRLEREAYDAIGSLQEDA